NAIHEGRLPPDKRSTKVMVISVDRSLHALDHWTPTPVAKIVHGIHGLRARCVCRSSQRLDDRFHATNEFVSINWPRLAQVGFSREPPRQHSARIERTANRVWQDDKNALAHSCQNLKIRSQPGKDSVTLRGSDSRWRSPESGCHLEQVACEWELPIRGQHHGSDAWLSSAGESCCV